MHKAIKTSLLASLISLPLPALALDVLITNDDGFETANIQALYTALKADGHRVIMAAPFLNQSGTSGSAKFLQPIFPTSEPSEGGALPAGSPGIGETGLGDDQYYADSTPVGAVLYGLELAQDTWGKTPDLVLSGPNDGNNLGTTTINSGTVGATVTALSLGIPAIALSAANDDTPELVAELSLQLVDELVIEGEVSLPDFTGLNVNFPIIDETDTADMFDYELTQIGTSSNIRPKFYELLADSPLANIFAGGPIPLPGVSVEAQNDYLSLAVTGFPGVFPIVPIGPVDNDPRSETNAILDGVVTVSVIEATYQASLPTSNKVGAKLNGLLTR